MIGKAHPKPKDRYGQPVTTAAWEIFHVEFAVYVPQMFTHTQEATSIMRSYNFMDPAAQLTQALEPMLSTLTISNMVYYDQQGATLSFHNTARDAPRVYSIISRHLKDWADLVERDYFTMHAPIQDLQCMEDFAIKLYRTAKAYIKEPKLNTEFGSMLDMFEASADILGVGRLTPKPQVVLPKDHQPLVLDINRELTRRKSKPWSSNKS